MKKFILLFISCLFVSLNMQAQPVPATNVKLDYDTIFLSVGDKVDLTAHVEPFNATNKNVSWNYVGSSISINRALNTIMSDTVCEVTALAIGDAKVIVTSSNNWRDTCLIRVVVPADDINFSNPDTIKMIIEDDTTLTVLLSPPGVTMDSVIWENLNRAVIGIEYEAGSTTCKVTALAVGEAKIVAKTYDYDGAGTLFEEFTDTCVVKVSYMPIQSLTLDRRQIEMTIGDADELIAHIEPYSRVDKSVEWQYVEATGPSIIDLSSGIDTIRSFTAVGVGTTKIVAISIQSQDEDELATDTCEITVRGIPATGMSLDHHTLNMDRTLPQRLVATVSPYNTTNKTIAWTSEDLSIVDPAPINDTTCVITAFRSGTAKIYARTLDGDWKDSCVVNVFVPVDSVVFQIADISIADTIGMEISDTIRLKATVYPDSATIKSVTWSISDLSIVDTTFFLRDTICDIIGLKKGEVQIYAIVNDRDSLHKDSCVFTVDYKPITGIDMHLPDTVEIVRTGERTLTATVSPFKATNDSVIWTSSNSSIVNILSTGYDTICNIKALSPGEAKIYVTSKINPTLKDSCVFKVLPIPVTDVFLSPDSMELYLNNKFKLIANTLPWNATEKSLTWTSSNSAIVEILSSADTICEISGKGIGEAKIYAIAPGGAKKDSCVVTVREQLVFLETDTVNVNGGIELFVVLPANTTFTGSFELQLPKGFGLTLGEVSRYRSSLTNSFKGILDLVIDRVTDSTYIFTILPKTTTTSSSAGAKIKIMDIVYTIYDNSLKDSKINYKARIVDVIFELDNDTKIEENKVEIVIKSFEDPTGNATIVTPANSSYINDGRLYVNTDKSETISVYSLNGSLLFTGNKKAGQAVFNLKTPEVILIVKGSSGWVNKVVNR